jgi:hypothetical protein
MKVVRRLAFVTLLGITSMAGAQIDLPDPTLPGGSMNTAVRIVATSDLMIDRSITRWLRKNYSGWDADPHEFTEAGGERYAVVYIKHPEHSSRRVYFRIVRSHADPDDGGTSFPF